MRYALAMILAGVTVAGAVFLATVHLKMHGHYHCVPFSGLPGYCDPSRSFWMVGRFVWQIPVAIVIGAVGWEAPSRCRDEPKVGSIWLCG